MIDNLYRVGLNKWVQETGVVVRWKPIHGLPGKLTNASIKA